MKNKKETFQILFLVAPPKLSAKAEEVLKKEHVPMQYHIRAKGTATSEVMDTLGLGDTEKDITISIMSKTFADDMLVKFKKKLHLGMPNSGIAFTINLSSGSGSMIKLIEETESAYVNKDVEERSNSKPMDSEYTMIMAMVNPGFSEEVMKASRHVGASGGTVLHSRRVGTEEALKFWGTSLQEEREIILIISEKKNKLPIMKAINEKCGMSTEAQGVVMSFPVDSTAGLS